MTENIIRTATQQLKDLIRDSRRPAPIDELMRVDGALTQPGVVFSRIAAVTACIHTFAVPHCIHTGSGHCIRQSTKTDGTASKQNRSIQTPTQHMEHLWHSVRRYQRS